MSSKPQRAGSRVAAVSVALIILVTGCVITFWLNNWQQVNTERRVAERFSFAASDAAALVERRLQHYENLLMGARGLFAASERVDRKEFADYARGIELGSRFPAALGLGYARVVQPLERQSYEQAIQDEGFSDFRIWPDYGRKIYTSIHFIEPFAGVNLNAFGYDMYAEHERHLAMERAMLKDTTALSRHVALVQDGQQGNYPGILIYVPVYDNGQSSVTSAQRRDAIAGWAYAVVRADLLISQTLSKHHPELQVTVHDGLLLQGQSSELYSTENVVEMTDSPLQITSVISFGGRQWSLVASASPSWIADAGMSGIDYRLFAGIFLSIALALCLYLTVLGRSNALELVRRQTQELQLQHDTLRLQTSELKDTAWRLKSEAQTRRKAESEGLALDSILHELSSELYMLSADNRLSIRRANRFAEKLSGLSQQELKRETLYDRFDPRSTKIIKTTVEQLLREKETYCSVDVERGNTRQQRGNSGKLDGSLLEPTTRMQIQLHLMSKGNVRIIGAIVVVPGADESTVGKAA